MGYANRPTAKMASNTETPDRIRRAAGRARRVSRRNDAPSPIRPLRRGAGAAPSVVTLISGESSPYPASSDPNVHIDRSGTGVDPRSQTKLLTSASSLRLGTD